MDKLKIIYIAGAGRSGSTLLEMILWTAPHAYAVGELKYLASFLNEVHIDENGEMTLIRDDQGKLAKESDFWADFVKQKDDYLYDNELDFIKKTRRELLIKGKVRKTPKLLKYNKLLPDIKNKAEKLTNQNIECIVDSSKNIGHLVQLKNDTDFDIYVLHLVRDLRGCAYSSYKHDGFAGLVRAVRGWLSVNVLLRRYLSKNFVKEKVLYLRYEEFVRDPAVGIQKINNWSGLEIDFDHYVENINKKTSYRFAGNKMRLKKFTGIEPDTKWKKNLPWYYKLPLGILNKVV